MPIDLDTRLGSWPYDLGWLFLHAAMCCGFACDRVYVADGTVVEGMAPGCPCQLVAIVDAAWEPVGSDSMALCMPRKSATVTLVLDMCVVLPDADHVPDPQAVSESARETVTARWEILKGLQQARVAENLGGGCRSIVPAGWIGVSQTGGIARWQSSWRFRTE